MMIAPSVLGRIAWRRHQLLYADLLRPASTGDKRRAVAYFSGAVDQADRLVWLIVAELQPAMASCCALCCSSSLHFSLVNVDAAAMLIDFGKVEL